MTFTRTTPDREYRLLRLRSVEGRWELGLSPYAYGIRLRMGAYGRPPSVMDFCLGTDVRRSSLALIAVLRRLEALEETTTGEQINAGFPWGRDRPDMAVHLDALLSE